MNDVSLFPLHRGGKGAQECGRVGEGVCRRERGSAIDSLSLVVVRRLQIIIICELTIVQDAFKDEAAYRLDVGEIWNYNHACCLARCRCAGMRREVLGRAMAASNEKRSQFCRA